MQTDPGYRIRQATVQDLPFLVELEASVYRDESYPRFVLRQMLDVFGPGLLVAEDATGLRGYVLAAPTISRDRGWILSVLVDAGFRQRGAGRALTEAGLTVLAGLGVTDVRLTVNPDNTAAVSLYEDLGFARVEVVEGYLGPGEDRLVMAAKLVPR